MQAKHGPVKVRENSYAGASLQPQLWIRLLGRHRDSEEVSVDCTYHNSQAVGPVFVAELKL